jgi:hypothetical protein
MESQEQDSARSIPRAPGTGGDWRERATYVCAIVLGTARLIGEDRRRRAPLAASKGEVGYRGKCVEGGNAGERLVVEVFRLLVHQVNWLIATVGRRNAYECIGRNGPPHDAIGFKKRW